MMGEEPGVRIGSLFLNVCQGIIHKKVGPIQMGNAEFETFEKKFLPMRNVSAYPVPS
jgi:hypothetical protein